MLYAIIILCSMVIVAVANIFTTAIFHNFSFWEIIVWTIVATVAVILIDGLCATIVRWLLPKKWFNGLSTKFSAGKRESRFYEKIGIKKWKDKVIELGGFTNFRKNKIANPNNNDYLLRYVMEANYGVVCHVVAIIFGFAVVFCCPRPLWLSLGLPVAFVSAILNALPTFILRYNLPKLHRLYRINEKRQLLATKKG